jgi:hypothetical protein
MLALPSKQSCLFHRLLRTTMLGLARVSGCQSSSTGLLVTLWRWAISSWVHNTSLGLSDFVACSRLVVILILACNSTCTATEAEHPVEELKWVTLGRQVRSVDAGHEKRDGLGFPTGTVQHEQTESSSPVGNKVNLNATDLSWSLTISHR